ncbi:MAG: hypothetical protein BJ554DRAFT_993 [Olpidium bornovanus]|uniref:CCHC-type domain-containing protein n=1 Tax=Olpidium bornovanus TaxID=278681 RepID=A0A8H7ZST2_9FUNG|nr:MAG: hypothetical protein BJ554DRAFT_993 [Olpidium bornovanus]
MEDLHLHLSRAEERSRMLEAVLEAQEDEGEGVKPEEKDADADRDRDEQARQNCVERFLREDLSTRRLHGYAEDEGGTAALTNFASKLDAAAEQANLSRQETLALATHHLTEQVAILWQSHANKHRRGDPHRWTRWKQLREELEQLFFPREHLQVVMNKLMELTQWRCDDDLEKYIETFNSLRQKNRVLTMAPNLEDLGSVQAAARRDFRLTDKPKVHNPGPTNGAGAAGEAKKGKDRQSIKCFNCNKTGHMARECRLPQKERKPKESATNSKAKTGKPDLQIACTAGVATDETEDAPSANSAANANHRHHPMTTRVTMDSGATRHMIPHKQRFTSSRPWTKKVWTASKASEPVLAEGTVNILTISGVTLSLKGALHTPTFKMPLFSIPAATYNGLDVLFMANGRAFITKGGKTVATATRDDRDQLFYLDTAQDDPTSTTQQSSRVTCSDTFEGGRTVGVYSSVPGGPTGYIGTGHVPVDVERGTLRFLPSTETRVPARYQSTGRSTRGCSRREIKGKKKKSRQNRKLAAPKTQPVISFLPGREKRTSRMGVNRRGQQLALVDEN